MASNYTENYGLCRWAATDQVLRTEFNEDNQKVDTALKGLADMINTNTSQLSANLDAKTSQLSAALTARVSELNDARRTDLLLDQTLNSDKSSVSLSLARINVNEYFRLDLVVHGKAAGSYPHIYMRFNGRSEKSYYPLSVTTSTSNPETYAMLLADCTAGGTVFCSIWGEGFDRNSIIWSIFGANPKDQSGFCVSGGRYAHIRYSQLTSLQFVLREDSNEGAVIKAGTRFRLYGLR